MEINEFLFVEVLKNFRSVLLLQLFRFRHEGTTIETDFFIIQSYVVRSTVGDWIIFILVIRCPTSKDDIIHAEVNQILKG